MRWILLLLMAALLATSSVRGQDTKAKQVDGDQPKPDVAKIIEQGLAYRAGDHVRAVTLLQEAINPSRRWASRAGRASSRRCRR
ncbi:MAG: hypothetical protein U1E76_27350 [Planctomycetota bacterium]